MPARVILTVVEGPMNGAKFRFDEQMLCIVGRADSCTLRLPHDASEGISRHHCLLEINPPMASIQDLGSRNGTFLNSVPIGVKGHEEPVKDGSTHLDQHMLKDGDYFKIGENLFKVALHPDARCAGCNAAIPESLEQAAETSPGIFLCDNCKAKPPAEIAHPSAKTVRIIRCSVCGKDVVADIPQITSGLADFICNDCRKDESCIVTRFMDASTLENRKSSLLPIQGYTVIKQIGRGGMGSVYLAEAHGTKERIALKIMLPQVAVDEQSRRDFLREAENSGRLKHRNIVELKGTGYTGGAFFITLEYCDGGTLRDYLKTCDESMDISVACDIALQVLDGLEYAHNMELPTIRLHDGATGSGKGLVHRDIKPENIFLCGDYPAWTAKIADFGLSKSFDCAGLSGCTRTGDFSGTLGFIPRQQFLNFKYVKPEVDVWAVAATLYYMLTLRTPRDFEDNPFTAILENAPIPIRKRNPGIPKKLAKAIDTALDDSESLHFKSAADFSKAIREALK